MGNMESDAPKEPAPGPEPRRRPQKKMTEADRAILTEFLQRPDARVNGKIHIPTVAKMTGLSYQQVYGFLRGDRFWAAQVAEVQPDKLVPTETDQIDADLDDKIATGVTISNAQFEEYRAMIRQNRKMLAADWSALGMTEEAGKRMEHYTKLGTTPTSMILRATTGQLISNLELLDRVIKADCERVLTNNLPEETTRNGEPKDPELVEREWRHTIFQGMKLQLDMFSHVHKAQALMARVMRELHLMNGGAAPAKKGDFEMPVAPVSERRD